MSPGLEICVKRSSPIEKFETIRPDFVALRMTLPMNKASKLRHTIKYQPFSTVGCRLKSLRRYLEKRYLGWESVLRDISRKDIS